MATRTEDDLRHALTGQVDPQAQERLAALIRDLTEEPERRQRLRAWTTPVLVAAAVAVAVVAGTIAVSDLNRADHVSPAGTTTAPSMAPSPSPTPSSAAPSPSSPGATPPSASPTPSASAPAVSPSALVSSGIPVDPASYHTGRFGPSGPIQTMPNVIQFQTPSGNIACTAPVSGELACVINASSFAPPARPASCGLNWAAGTVIFGTVPQLGACLGNPIVTSGSSTLAYGHVLRFGDFACYSGQSALTCLRSSSGHGFNLSRQAYTVF